MKSNFFILIIFLAISSCTEKKDSIIGIWIGKNYLGQNVQWVFKANGKASSMKNGVTQEMLYKTDQTQIPYHLDVNSLVDTNTLRAIYKFTENGKLIIAINDDPVTIRPSEFTAPNTQRLTLTKKE